MKSRVVIGSRGSKLALYQSNYVADLLRAAAPGLDVRIEVIHTQGDKILDAPLAKIGGKGLFTKELEVALLENAIDIAVHSLKDLPTELPEGLAMGAVPRRATPYDAFVSSNWNSLDSMPQGARIGTSSLRRAAQLLAFRPDLHMASIRGNVETRLKRVEEGAVDATILACAGLERLGLSDRITQQLDEDIMISAPAQGAIGIELREIDSATKDLVRQIGDAESEAETRAERTCLAALEGGCQVPIGALARVRGSAITLKACVCSLDGKTVLRSTRHGSIEHAFRLGGEAADELLEQGAAEIIVAIR